MDILYDWAFEPISVTVIGEKVKVIRPPLVIDGMGELTPGEHGLTPLVEFYTDLGWRHVYIDQVKVR